MWLGEISKIVGEFSKDLVKIIGDLYYEPLPWFVTVVVQTVHFHNLNKYYNNYIRIYLDIYVEEIKVITGSIIIHYDVILSPCLNQYVPKYK